MPECDRDWIQDEFIPSFQRMHQYLWKTMIRTDTNIHILEEIESFRIDQFLGGERLIFWQSVVNNACDMVVIKLSSLLKENGKDGLSLRMFRNTTRNWVHEHRRNEFDELGRDAKFDARIRDLENDVRAIRNNLTAHLLWDYDQNGRLACSRVGIRELRELFEATRRLWNSVTPFSGFSTVYCSYGTIGGHQKDIRIILKASARQNMLFSLPESDPSMWSKKREKMSPDEIADYNNLRKQLDLPPVP
jgi:hypothetical protein